MEDLSRLAEYKKENPGRLTEEQFEILEQELLPEGRLHILEVGCGSYPRLSLLLKAQGHSLTCMDPGAELVEEEGIEVRREAFDWESVDLGGYDFVVAQEPCEATEHIVRACTGQRVPFAMVLCGVPHALLCGVMLIRSI